MTSRAPCTRRTRAATTSAIGRSDRAACGTRAAARRRRARERRGRRTPFTTTGTARPRKSGGSIRRRSEHAAESVCVNRSPSIAKPIAKRPAPTPTARRSRRRNTSPISRLRGPSEVGEEQHLDVGADDQRRDVDRRLIQREERAEADQPADEEDPQRRVTSARAMPRSRASRTKWWSSSSRQTRCTRPPAPAHEQIGAATSPPIAASRIGAHPPGRREHPARSDRTQSGGARAGRASR